MIGLLAQAEPTFWTGDHGSSGLWIKILVAVALGAAAILLMMSAPTRARRPIVAGVTFFSGLFYVLYFLWPKPIDKDEGELPRNALEGVSFWLGDGQPVVTAISNVLTWFLLGLGIYSLLRIHGRRLFKLQKDWFFSLMLLLTMFAMVIFGYGDWRSRLGEGGPKLEDPSQWATVNYGRDFLFDGLFQQMEAAMFSIIAFFILSAAYRAFRIRSVEATILLATALLFVLSLMGVVEAWWGDTVSGVSENLSLTSIKTFMQASVQTPSIRAIDFGIGLGALAMGLRLWLSLEKAGSSA